MPSFFIDTSVFISTIKTDNSTEACEKFIRRVKNGHLFDILEAIVSSNAEWFIPQNNDLCLFSQLREVDNRVEDGDILHATCAKILSIPLVTIDGRLLKSRGLMNQGIEILHPTQVINK